LAQGYLGGIQVNVPTAGVLTAIGVVLANGATANNMYFGVYNNAASYPTTLKASTGTAPVAVTPGGVEVPVGPVDIAAGDYWILGTWNSTATFASNSTSLTKTLLLSSFEFGQVPASAPTAMTAYTRIMPNLYLVVAQ
jgi:hypothetical protein